MARKPSDIIVPRPGFSEKNARRFLYIIDKLIENETGQDLYIDPDSSGLAFTTFRHRLSEALLWLSIYPLDGAKPVEEYQKLKGKVEFKTKLVNNKWQVGCHFKQNIGLIQSNITVEDSAIIGRNVWKEKLIDFMANPNEQVFILQGVRELGTLLTPSDIDWIKKTLDSVDIIYEVNQNLLKAAK